MSRFIVGIIGGFIGVLIAIGVIVSAVLVIAATGSLWLGGALYSVAVVGLILLFIGAARYFEGQP